MRLFLSIPVPASTQAALSEIQGRLRKLLPGARIRWTPQHQFHLTLLFFGEVPTERAESLVATLAETVRDFGALQLSAEKLGLFPERSRPRVIWAGAREAHDRLIELHRRVSASAQQFCAERGNEQFAGHVTLGRVREMSRAEAAILMEQVRAQNALRFGAWTVDALKLMRSELAADGAQHHLLAPIPL